MLLAGLFLTALWTAALLYLKVLVRQAPEAYEDDKGFHVVAQPEPAGAVMLPALRPG